MAASPPLLTVRDLTFGYGTPPLLEGVDFRVDAGDRLALLGRNGSGKSTLLKLLAREMEPESGEISAASTLRVAGLTQNVPNDLSGTTFDVVARGLDDGGIALGTAVADYRRLTRRGPQSDAEDEALVKAQELLEQKSAWGRVEDAEKVISRLKLDADVSVDSLSAGVLRRVLLARALASDPQVLLLDEPTNHLDID
ncbi:MAG: ATP-binding cassette domain-containing protein [Planctomycetota bacterium]